ncbi:hypothetical protein [Fluviicola sp.]|uniref:hypothetical protein n=1 Tax=Fluviicola sp. TaxID=1917219 RepID=UPI00261AAE5A|nr:hypothetical protein [Fluviicola sp.]
MTALEIISVAAIYFILPICGLIGFLYLCEKMKREKVANAPVEELFGILWIYGTLFVVFLSALFWGWSGVALLGMVFLFFVAPFLMAWISIRLSKKKGISKYHVFVWNAAMFYFLILPLCLVVLYVVE